MMRENINFTKQKILFPIHQDLSLWCKIVQLWGKYLFLERWTGDRNPKVSMGHKTKQNIRTKQNKVFFWERWKWAQNLKVSLGQLGHKQKRENAQKQILVHPHKDGRGKHHHQHNH